MISLSEQSNPHHDIRTKDAEGSNPRGGKAR
jgi:hypothetical protein